MSEKKFFQRGFGLKAAVAEELSSVYASPLIDALRANGHELKTDSVELYLAEEFGFCYGVDRAVDYAYEARRHFPDRRIYLTNEIIHNPYVNGQLRDMGIKIIGEDSQFEEVERDDVVLLPAFGATVELIDDIKERGAVIVDTTCGSVMNVWKMVERFGRDGYTSVVHGKYAHEETVATCSRATSKGGHYIVVRDESETQLVIDWIVGRSQLNREQFLERFKKAVSQGFDPDLHLRKVGVANQTTMLATESAHISKIVGEAIAERDGDGANFREFDTICSATQDRQDAILKLCRRVELDLILVVGGYNSSNTGHLCEISGTFAPAYHIDGPGAILSAERIEHQIPGQKHQVEHSSWIPEKRPLRVGVTSGASTPNSIVTEVIDKLGAMLKVDFHELLSVPRGEQPAVGQVEV